MILAVTGASGTVGKEFPADALSLNTRLEAAAMDMLRELTNQRQSIDTVIHLAAMTLVSDCQARPDEAVEFNVNGALKWFSAAAEAGVKHFILASTSHVYGNPLTQTPISTSHPVKPNNVYGQTKLTAEQKLQELSLKFPHTKLTIARMFSLISKKSNPGLLYSNLHRRAQEHDFSAVPGLSYTRDFSKVEFAVEKLIDLSHWQQAPDIVHICSGKARTVLNLAEEVFAEYGLDAKKLLSEAPGNPQDIPYIVGLPTQIPSRF